jgi:alcohol dehydrogenase YqhD (iron-dependent ADH family)
MWSGTLAHNDLCGCGRAAAPEKRAGGWESHGLEHEISAHRPEVTHGAWPGRYSPRLDALRLALEPERFLAFAQGVFSVEPVDETDEATEDAITFAIDELQRFFVGLGMPQTLADLGLAPEEVDGWLETLRQNKGERFGELRPLTMDDARAIYLSAF